MDKNTDEIYMRRCLQLARGGMHNAKPNPMVGAVIVSDGRIIGEGFHVRCGEGHAEVNAFASVRPEDAHLLHQATIYVSLEPCSHFGRTPPCADLIINKGVKRVVVGCQDPFIEVSGRGIKRLKDAGIDVTVGVLEDECKELNKRFITYNIKKRPYIILKWATTINGFIDDNYRPAAISTPFTSMLSHKLRAENDAILVGRVTAERDKPQLNVRHWYGDNPRRIVLTHETDIHSLMNKLHEQGVQSLIVEGGAVTHESFITEDLWDEIRVETSPKVFQDGTKAPSLPNNLRLMSHEDIDGNTISIYRHQ